MMGAICGASRGKHGVPEKIDGRALEFINENEEPTIPPKKYPCEHPKHWDLGNGTRNGQKLYYPLEEMFTQKWILTEEEFAEALEQYDVFSLDMQTRIICFNCANYEFK